MLTWRLWRALRYPPVSPLLRLKPARPAQRPRILRRRKGFRRSLPGLLLGLAVLALVSRYGILALFMGMFAIPGSILLIFLGLPLLLPLASLFLGSYWAADIIRNIRRERVRRRWDLLCAAPTGAQGASHAIVSRCLLRGGVFSTVHGLQQIALGLCLAGMLLMGGIFLVMLLRGEPAGELIPALRTTLDLTALTAAMWLHWQQTVALVALTGLLLAGSEGGEPPWFAVLLFPALQVGSWTFFALQLQWLQPLTEGIAPEMWALAPLGYLALFVLAREGLVHILWRAAGQRMQTKEVLTLPLRRSATGQTG